MPRARGKRGGKNTKKPAVEEANVEKVLDVTKEPDESIGSDSQNTSSIQESSQDTVTIKEQKEAVENIAPKEQDEHSVSGEQEANDVTGDVVVTEIETVKAHDVEVDKLANDKANADETMETNELNKERLEGEKETKQRKAKKPVMCYKPHTIPVISNKTLLEKWEWHLKFFPIDQSDIRSCILESVSKIAQETWLYIDKQNFGMGSYDMCVRSHNDAAMIMLKTLAMPLMYRYLTVEITRRGQNETEVERIVKAREAAEDSNEDDSENLPYSEVLEKATLLLDFMHTPTIEKVKGQEKKRCLYVKYLPEGTTKEFLKVLFPVANNLDIITTGEGRRVGSLNVSSVPNMLGICNAYVAIHVEEDKTIALDWRGENLDDGIVMDEAFEEIPWEIIPRQFEYPYETVPEMTDDDYIEYAKRRRNLEDTLMGHDPKERDRERRRGRDMEADVVNVLQMQHEMNEKISSQIALLSAVEGAQRTPPSLLGVPPLMSLVPGEPSFLRGHEERRDGRGERDRRNSGGGRRSPDRRDQRDRRDRSRRDRVRDGRSSRWDNDGPPRNERDKGNIERDRSSGRDGRREDRGRDEPKRRSNDRGRGPGLDIRDRRRMFGGEREEPFDMRFPERFDRPGPFGQELGGRFPDELQRFEVEERSNRFEMEERRRRGPFPPDGRMGRPDSGGREGLYDEGRGPFPNFDRGPPEMEMGRGKFGNRGGRGRMEDRPRGRFEERGRGSRSDEPSFGGPGGRNFGGRGGMVGNAGSGPAGRFDTPAGKGPDAPGRGGHFDRGGRGGRNMGRGGFGNSGPSGNKEGFGNQRGPGGRGGGHSSFGNRQDGGQWNNAIEQQTPALGHVGAPQRPKHGGNMPPVGGPKKDDGRYQNQRHQGGMGNQDSFRKEGGNIHKGANKQQMNSGNHSNVGNQQQKMPGQSNYGNQGMKGSSHSNFGHQKNTNPQSSFGTQHDTSGGFGKRQNTASKPVTGNQQNAYPQNDFSKKPKVQVGFGNQQNISVQSGYGNQPKSYGNQPKGNRQGGFGSSQNIKPQTGYGNQQNMMGTQGGFGTQQTNQAGYNANQGTAVAQSGYGNQAPNPGPGNYTSQQNTFPNQQTSLNNQQTSYGMSENNSYNNQAYSGYADNTYNQNYMGAQPSYGNYDSNMWSQNVDYSQYGASNYGANQPNTYTPAGTQAQQMPGGNTSTSNSATGYGASGMGYSADANYAAQGYYNAGPTDSSVGYAGYGSQDATGYNMGSASTLATYDFASYNNGSS